jgi:Peptidoglycan-synthase activator LpoB
MAADKMSRDLLADPTLNASSTAWTMVVTSMEDKTTDRANHINFDIFLQALKGDLAQKSAGRVQLIENKAEFHNVRNQELEGGDQFGQGAAPAPAAINPDYALTGTAMDLPNRATNFYQIEFKLVNLHNRTLAFNRVYQVKVAR